jgi:hypothetical protein
MTEDAIVTKLRGALSKTVDSEAKVLYLLAESRKLLETYPSDPRPIALKIYCHWALHVNKVPAKDIPGIEYCFGYLHGLFQDWSNSLNGTEGYSHSPKIQIPALSVG